MGRWHRLPLIALAVSLLGPAASAQSCTSEQIRKVVDDTGAVLRRINAESRQRLDTGLKRLKEKNGWSEDDYLEKANLALSDARSDAYDVTATDLLGKLDRLGEETPTGAPDCSRLGELEATALELQATVRVKTQYMLARLDQLTAEPPKGGAQPAPSPAPAKKEAATVQPPALPPTAREPSPAPVQPKSAPPKAPSTSWTTSTQDGTQRAPPGGDGSRGPASQPPPLPSTRADPDGFSIDEIREASRGFFGTISSGLAGVMEHAFSSLGRPTAYVLGNEGGGAFIAGVRYGKGVLFTRGGKSRDVHWHGPSIGYDFGASGSKALFLIYNLREELDIFTGFSGVEGSAYLVGGVGMTVLTDGKIVMAPIRSGVGLRLGASIGYIRFTARPTWNPF